MSEMASAIIDVCPVGSARARDLVRYPSSAAIVRMRSPVSKLTRPGLVHTAPPEPRRSTPTLVTGTPAQQLCAEMSATPESTRRRTATAPKGQR
jgi:hypothetical protein